MQSQSRRERRKLAKQMGLLGKKETLNQTLERTRRAKEYGEMLHLQHLTRQANQNSEK